MAEISKKYGHTGVWVLMAIHLLVALPLAYYLNIWSDEASSLHTTQNGILNALQIAATDERQAPMYFWLLSIWRTINGSIFFARLPSIALSLLSIRLFAGFAKKLFEPRAALLATAFFALHPILFWASLEIRVYSLIILLTIVLVRTFYAGFFADTAVKATQRIQMLLFVAVAIFGLYTNYYLGFLLVGCFAAVVITAKWRAARDYLLCMAVVGISIVPLVLTIKSQFNVNANSFSDERSLSECLSQLWSHVLTFVMPTDIVVGAKTTLVSLARLWTVRIAIGVTGIFLVLRRDRLTSQTLGFAAIVSTILCSLVLAYFALGKEFILIRHASVLFAPLIISLASLANDLFSRKKEKGRLSGRFAAPVFAVVMLASFSYALVNLYPNGAKAGDWSRVARYIEQNETPNQTIIIFHTYDAMILPYEYHGQNRILPDDRFLDFDFTTPSDEHNKVRTEFTLSKIPPDAAEIWLITNNECGTAGVCEQLENFVQVNYNVEKESEFYLQRVRLLRKKQ